MDKHDHGELLKDQRLDSEYCPNCMTRHHPLQECDPIDLERRD